ncbi:MAG: ThuA domain-containing protein [Planctomycetaceae bacterium]|jgi:type 1 glutamine amidotransferase|nr:ThuA domain-containing protein [Planctomycetaceae bacterium]
MRLQKIVLTLICAIGIFAAINCAMKIAAGDELTRPKIKTLIIDGDNNHNWKATTPLLKKLLEDTGRFVVDVISLEKSGGIYNVGSATFGQELVGKEFTPVFDKFELVVLNFNNHRGGSWSEATRKGFEKFVADGGGVVVYHAADNAFREWKEFNKMIAFGGWGGRNESDGPYLYINDDGKIIRDESKGSGGNHGRQWAFLLKNREPLHPIMKGLPEEFRHTPDELYDRMRGPAENVTILATAYAEQTTKRHEPMLLAIDYGKGRVFHTTLGHDAKQTKSVAFIITFQRGAEWAATGKVTIPVPEDMPAKETPVERK